MICGKFLHDESVCRCKVCLRPNSMNPIPVPPFITPVLCNNALLAFSVKFIKTFNVSYLCGLRGGWVPDIRPHKVILFEKLCSEFALVLWTLDITLLQSFNEPIYRCSVVSEINIWGSGGVLLKKRMRLIYCRADAYARCAMILRFNELP